MARRTVAQERLPPVGLAGIAIVVAIVGSVLLEAPFRRPGLNIALVDAVFGVILLLGLTSIWRPRGQAGRMLRRLLPWIWLLVFSQLMGLRDVGIQGWAMVAFVKNLLPPLVFVIVLGLLLGHEKRLGLAMQAWWWVAAGVAALTIIEGGYRPAGTFTNPNYTAHFLVASVIIAFYAPISRWQKWLLAALAGVAVVLTSSYMGLAMVAGAAAYWLWSSALRLEARLRIVMRLIAAVLLLVVGLLGFRTVDTVEFELNQGVTSERFDRSREDRIDLWQSAIDIWIENPLGVGPAGLDNRPELRERAIAGEAHSDVFDSLLAGGVLSLVGTIGVVVVIWRAAPAAGATRLLLSALVAAALVRQTWNFRHAWLALAVLLAWDLTAALRRTEAERREDGAQHPLLPSAADRSDGA